MLRSLRRGVALAFWGLTEAILHSLGRRPPYDVLVIDVDGPLSEQPPEYPLPVLSARPQQDYGSLVVLLRWAREDPSVRGVFVRCGHLGVGWARVQEIHRCLLALRSAGKTVTVWLPHAGIHEYVLASAANRVVLAPAGTLDINGLSSEFTFFGDALRKFGVQPEVVQRGRFKTSAEAFTRSSLSAEYREMAESLLDDLYDQIVETVAGGRSMEAARVRALLDGGPYVAGEAEANGLIDAVQYEDQALESLTSRYGESAATIDMHDYEVRRTRATRREWLRRGGRTIGLLHIDGSLKTGENLAGPGPISASGAAAVCRDLKSLREREDIRAVVLRISSPGGSGLASDLIWHEVERTREQKPVLVSLGDVAASGGYYIALAGRPVFAEEGTLTGSIGVLAGKAVLRDLYNRVGITKELVTRGRGGSLYSDYFPLGEEERQRLQAQAESFYAAFLDKVVRGRGLSEEGASAAAEGRVWTGRQARGLGLVDELGGLECVLRKAKGMAAIPADEPVAVERLPRPRRFLRLALGRRSPRLQLPSVGEWVQSVATENLWAVLPFRLRFF